MGSLPHWRQGWTALWVILQLSLIVDVTGDWTGVPGLQWVWGEREHVDKHRIPAVTWLKCSRLNGSSFSRIWPQLWTDQEIARVLSYCGSNQVMIHSSCINVIMSWSSPANWFGLRPVEYWEGIQFLNIYGLAKAMTGDRFLFSHSIYITHPKMFISFIHLRNISVVRTVISVVSLRLR